MTLKMIGTKKGMTQIFDERGNLVVCTVIAVEPHVVAQLRNRAIQLAAEKLPEARVRGLSKPLKGHFAKAGVEPHRYLLDVPVDDVETFKVGQQISVGQFQNVAYVDVQGMSKGKGHQGVIKRHHFAGGPAAHGSGFRRHGGSTGMRTSPGRCLPGQKKSGRMGGELVTTQNLKVVRVDEDRQLLLVKGAIPGPRNCRVAITQATKKAATKKK